MKLKKIQDADLKGKKVLLRVDFNVAVANGKIKEKFKIAAVKKTIDHILSQEGARLALVSHLGRPSFTEIASFQKSHSAKAAGKYSFAPLAGQLGEVLGTKIIFAPACAGQKVAAALEKIKPQEALLLENVRLYPGDEINDAQFSREMSANFDIFINDAFSVSHRDQASVTGVAGILPAFAGFRLQEEMENLNRVKNRPESPSVAVIGGAKIETKLPLIQMFEKKYDTVLVGGKIAVEAQSSQIPFSAKVILPPDYAENKLDIGPETVKKFSAEIAKAKTIVWNGPMGKFEELPFDSGTREVLKAVVKSDAFSVVGGGESVQVLEEQNLLSKISFVSTGGGAMLEYLSGNKLPGIEVLVV